ncbi:MAG: hypothetical protein FGM18_00490 [Burkholderiaceae bacterium]|nr:hypothetical protein [Burkholderiaceae bacterium]
MKPKAISLPVDANLAPAVAQAMSALDGLASPVLLVDSPLAAAALKTALAQTSWPGREQGAPLPWCGTLEQAFDELVIRTLQASSGGIVLSPPRSTASRRVELAQQLLDYKDLRASLGASPRAALSLAAQWAALFDGWEWLETDHSLPQARHLSEDLAVLRRLHLANRREHDRVAWLKSHAAGAKSTDHGSNQLQVWFCFGISPSALELSMAKLLWGVDVDAITIWSYAPVLVAQQMSLAVGQRRLIAANTLEESAWAAVKVILDWRAQGMDDIGVVALDRKAVRRMRALLERAGESLGDRSGWALDTTVVASAVVGLNDLLIRQATTQSLLEWIHSPYVLAGLKAQFGFDSQRQRALDDALRGFGRIAAIDLADLIQQDLLPFSASVITPASAGARFSLAQWGERLLLAMAHCGLESTLVQDPAGQSLIAALQGLQARAHGDDTLISASLWHAVLTEELNRARFVEPRPGAAVRVVSLSSLCWHQPKAVLIVGGDSARLPQRLAPQFFEPKRFAEMGLQNDPQQIESEQFAQFLALWQSGIPLTVIATSDKPDSEVEFSPWLQLLSPQTPESAAEVVPELGIAPESYVPKARMDGSIDTRHDLTTDQGVPIAGAVWPYALPAEITVSQAQSLIDCPYQFMLARLMGLAQVPELEEDAASADLGSLVHLVLKGATQTFSSIPDCNAWLVTQIDTVLSRPFFCDRHGRPLNLPMPAAIRVKLRADVMAIVPELARWLYGASVAGGQVVTEHDVQRVLESVSVTLKGRIDRWEKTGQRLIDFKTTDAKALSKRVGPQGEDLQLPLYAWLAAQTEDTPAIDDVRYVSVRREGVVEVSLQEESGQDVHKIAAQAAVRVADALKAIQSREPVFASGMNKEDRICDYCSVRGVCRRDEVPHES